MTYTLQEISNHLEDGLTEMMKRSGMMFRLFSRVKTERSIRHKMDFKGALYRAGKATMQDIIGFRIVLYFQDDVEALTRYLTTKDLVRKSVDAPDSTTFRPQRLNITRNLPVEFVEDFRRQLPAEFSEFIDSTYEVQIRTIFSEGWHEVEHDLRYKCKEDWLGCEQYSRSLNGVIATLETAEWSMKSIFHDMAYQNYRHGNYRAMMRNKLRIRLVDDDFSPAVSEFLQDHREVAKGVIKLTRLVFVTTLLTQPLHLDLTFDNVLFLINRLDIHNCELQALESDETRIMLDDYLKLGKDEIA